MQRLLPQIFFGVSLFLNVSTAIAAELHRVVIHNVANGLIEGSRDRGLTWEAIGKVVQPIQGGVWKPSVDNGVTAFDYQRGNSTIFASAINAIHIRFSDPKDYTLPTDIEVPPVEGHGVSLRPKDQMLPMTAAEASRTALTNISAGTGLFGPEWSPTVGSRVFMGTRSNFNPIPYQYGPNSNVVDRQHILIVTDVENERVDYLEFENKESGKVLVKRLGKSAPQQIAKVLKPVSGIGRFGGSEFTRIPGTIRANHSGVVCIGTTDANVDGNSSTVDPRGGFQIVPSHHYQDRAMRNGSGHPTVYMVVGPIQDPPHLKRYDMGIDGQGPLFKYNFRAGDGKTLVRFRNDEKWVEISEAVQQGRFKTMAGAIVNHLRGYVTDALWEVDGIRIYSQRQ